MSPSGSELAKAAVLGMNRRNAEYIMRCNARSAFPLVDDKVLTKGVAEKHQIPTPRLYHVIEHQGQIRTIEKELDQYHEFAVKPARGAGGSGIVLITNHEATGFTKSSGELISWEDLSFHVANILSGIYSLGGLPDRAIVECLIHPDPIFAAVSYRGVPDIRIIVYRGVPVMGMVRLPTKVSDGKANLHRGAIGVGIDISSGRTLMAVHRSRVITHHPDTGHSVNGIEIPYWRQMLLIAARATDMTGLGYLGVDLVIDRDDGPLLLELNARPGLAIQLANRSGLLSRLTAVDHSPSEIFASATARITWAMEKFAARGL
jgi:alpha-L-glutamate ligase-like protein